MPKVVNEDGEVWAVPAWQFGFCPAVVARRAEPADPVGFSLVYLWPVPSEDVPGVGVLPPLPELGDGVGRAGRASAFLDEEMDARGFVSGFRARRVADAAVA